MALRCISSSLAVSLKARVKRLIFYPGRSAVLRCACLACITFFLSGCSIFFSAAERGETFQYFVERGDTLTQIAELFDVPIDDIIELNELSDPNAIEIGQLILIPGDGARASFSPGPAARSAQTADTEELVKRYAGTLVMPLSRAKITSFFGTRWMNFHEGIDFSAPSGTPIYAAHDGRVVYNNDRIRGYGNMLVIKNESLLTVYAHNRRNLVERGTFVKKGDKIAEVGATGKASGPHLHFETRIRNGAGKYVAVDPLAFYPLRQM